ncbi:MAG TPA: 30S ribosomal protein S20 [Anaerolineales bacterium]|nr:30S ribosomal protein S20 [Anaerolineales bacterium]
MANTKSAQKRARQTEKRTLVNKSRRSAVRTAVRVVREALAEGNAADAESKLVNAISALDRAAQRGLIHKNNASRRKGRLMAQLAALKAAK